MAEPSPAVQASNENTAVILDRIKSAEEGTKERIATSDKRTTETFEKHEARDQERFADQTKALNDHREHLDGTLTVLTTEVKRTNSRLGTVEGKVDIVEDRASEIAKRKAFWLSWKQGIALALASGGGVWLVHVLTT